MIILLPLKSYAAGPLGTVECTSFTSSTGSTVDQGGAIGTFAVAECYIQNSMIVMVWIAGIGSLFMIMIAGFMFMTSAGDSKKVGTAKNALSAAIIGLAITVLGWGIADLVRTRLGLTSITNPDAANSATGSDIFDRLNSAINLVPSIGVSPTASTPGGGGGGNPPANTGYIKIITIVTGGGSPVRPESFNYSFQRTDSAGASVGPVNLSGSSAGTLGTLPAGDYSITSIPPTNNYTPSFSAGCRDATPNITIVNDNSIVSTCTITQTYHQ